ncbi:MlaD family protein [Aldersonia kunmingensis]|uniref:MlaD family protein n=1 Tax=Aldersonia kunmingensis TaxID=408066 RepID=UPI000A05CF46|nr:MlaD family protein [Aldersonia kunmingensis]
MTNDPMGPLTAQPSRRGRFGRSSGTKPRLRWTQVAEDRRQLRLGIAGALFLAMLVVVTGVLYALPIGKSTYAADLTEVQGLQKGAEVRLAGVTVGKVTGLELQPERVRMSFTVNDDVFVGDQTTLDVRMLTLVGGKYVALVPAGTEPLGSKVIPSENVRLPYSLVRTLQDAARPISEVNGSTLRENVTQLQTALDKSPDSLRQIGSAVESLVVTLDRQNAEVSRALAVSDEYLTALNRSKSLLGTFLRKLGGMQVLALSKQAEIELSMKVTAELLARLAAIEPTWRESMQPVLHQLTLAGPQMQELSNKLGAQANELQALRDRLLGAVSDEGGIQLDQSDVALFAPSVCVPVPGRGC